MLMCVVGYDCIVSNAQVVSPCNSGEEESVTLENKILAQIIS